jgi:hypothetical protein
MPLSRTNLLGQITSGNFGTGNFVSTAFTPASNSLLVVGVAYVENSGTTTDPTSALTISGGSLTWTQQQTAVAAPTAFPTLVKIWTAPVTTGASMSVTLSAGGVRSAGLYGVSAVCYTGHNTGSPVGGTATGSQNGGFTGPPDPKSITLSAPPAAGDEVFGFVFADKNTAGTSPGSAFTEIDDLNNTNWGSLESEIRTASTSTTVDWVDLRPGGGSIFNFAAVAIVIKAAAAGAQASAQQPIVVSAPRTAPAGQQVLLRNTAALIVPPAKGSLALVVTQPSVAPAAASLLRRNTLADPPVLTTAGPIVTTRPGQPPASQALLLRGPLVDAVAPSAATPGPLVVTSPTAVRPAAPILVRTAPPTQPSPAPIVVAVPAAAPPAVVPVLLRAGFADAPVLTTASPLVVSAPVPPAAAAAVLARNPQAPVASPATSTSPPIVVTTPAAPAPGQALMTRGSLSDPPVLTTASPTLVTAAAQRPAGLTIVIRGPQLTAVQPATATPGPIVVTATQADRPSRPVLGRGSLADVFYAGAAPIVVTRAAPAIRGATVLVAATRQFAVAPTGTSSPTPELVTRSGGRDVTVGEPSRNLVTRTASRNLVTRTTSRNLEV